MAMSRSPGPPRFAPSRPWPTEPPARQPAAHARRMHDGRGQGAEAPRPGGRWPDRAVVSAAGPGMLDTGRRRASRGLRLSSAQRCPQRAQKLESKNWGLNRPKLEMCLRHGATLFNHSQDWVSSKTQFTCLTPPVREPRRSRLAGREKFETRPGWPASSSRSQLTLPRTHRVLPVLWHTRRDCL